MEISHTNTSTSTTQISLQNGVKAGARPFVTPALTLTPIQSDRRRETVAELTPENISSLNLTLKKPAQRRPQRRPQLQFHAAVQVVASV